MTVALSLAVTNTPWIPERLASCERLMLDLQQDAPSGLPVRVFSDREPNHVWSARMWSWAVNETDADWCLFLQDDVEIASNFWSRLESLLSAAPSAIVGLESVHPATMDQAREGY